MVTEAAEVVDSLL